MARDTVFFRNAHESAPRPCNAFTVFEGLKEEWEPSQSRRQLKRAQAKASIMRVLRHQSPETHERMDCVFSRKKRDLSSPALKAKVTLAMELPLQRMTPGVSLRCPARAEGMRDSRACPAPWELSRLKNKAKPKPSS